MVEPTNVSVARSLLLFHLPGVQFPVLHLPRMEVEQTREHDDDVHREHHEEQRPHTGQVDHGNGQCGDQAAAEERFEHRLLVAERLERRGLGLRVHHAHEDQPGGGHAHGLAEVTDTALEPVAADDSGCQPQEDGHVERDADHRQDGERRQVVPHGLQRERGDGGDDQAVQRETLDAQHDLVVDVPVEAQPTRMATATIDMCRENGSTEDGRLVMVPAE